MKPTASYRRFPRRPALIFLLLLLVPALPALAGVRVVNLLIHEQAVTPGARYEGSICAGEYWGIPLYHKDSSDRPIIIPLRVRVHTELRGKTPSPTRAGLP